MGEPTVSVIKSYKAKLKGIRLQRQSDMPIVAKMSKDTKTLTERRGITLTLPPKEGRTGRLPKRLSTPALSKVQNFQRGLYLKAKRKVVKAFRRVVIGKPCEGEPHARFDEGAVETQFSCAPLLYSTKIGDGSVLAPIFS